VNRAGPKGEGLGAGDAQRAAGNSLGAAPFWPDRPIEEGEVGARAGEAISVEQVVGADIILVDRLLHQPHAEDAGVEIVVARRIGRDRGQVMDSVKLHHSNSFVFCCI